MMKSLLTRIDFASGPSYGAIQLIETGTGRVIDEIVGDVPKFVRVVDTPDGPKLMAAEPEALAIR